MCAARIFTGLDDNAEHARNQAYVVEVAQRLASIWLYRNTTLPSSLPRHPAAAHRRGDLLPQPLFDHRPPRHQAESHAVIQHRVATAGEHDVAPVDAGHTLSVGQRAMFQSDFGGDVLCGLRSSLLTPNPRPNRAVKSEDKRSINCSP